MRYYSLYLNTNAEKLKEKAKINLREYSYDGTINAVNNYMCKCMRNEFSFFIYRECENALYAVFSYDDMLAEEKLAAYDYILEMLDNVFQISKVQASPEEITMYHFMDCLNEAKRREYLNTLYRIVEASKLWIYDYSTKITEYRMHYSFTEKIIPNESKYTFLCDESLKHELKNICAHKNETKFSGNMVHYIISSHSIDAASDMAEALMQSLLKANRLKSKRMEIIRNIEPDLYSINYNRIETIIENNFGGGVIIDLSEKFGHKPTDYVMTAKYIENLVKQYHNKCLFIFTYNIDNPGFSYYLLPELKKYIIPVTLKEGSGDRKAAIGYMQHLIKSSAYAEYCNQASEYMKLYKGNKFTQTDVMNAYEQFDSWCLNKNIMQAYDYNVSKEFILDRDEKEDSSYTKLQNLIGLELVKKQIDSIIASDIVEKERKRRSNSYKTSTMHMIFGGNPGTAKTTVAKLFAGIAKEKGILKSGAFVECGGMDLEGFSSVENIREAFMAAKGGVLFIDEAYSLKSDIAVTVLLQEMENQRDNVIVILAGYNERMEAFMKINEGLKSRIPHWIEFPDYTAEELTDIFKLMLKERGFEASEDTINEAYYLFEKMRNVDNFGNGRYVRNLIENATQNQAVRLMKARTSAESIKKKELFKIIKEDISALDDGLFETRPLGTARKELDEMIGLSSVKSVINKAIAKYKLNKLCLDRGIKRENASLHMVFTGNPGTAKTTVARLFAEIMRDEKVLPTGAFVEVGRADLVGVHVGETAKIVKRKFKEAQGGVLFIDEAYSLCDSYENGFGDEAINTIVQEMENHREEVIVIFAGYPKPMEEFLDRNPGMLSRIAFQISFEDYTTSELCKITKFMLSRKEMYITDSAMDKLKENYENIKDSNRYGNGRYVRKLLEEAEMNLAERLLSIEPEDITREMLITIDKEDIPNRVQKKKEEKLSIGFAC